jgi:hypothetical protein
VTASLLGLVLFLLSLPGLSFGEVQVPLPFDPQTVTTVRGIVVDAPVIREGGLPEMVHFTMKAGPETLVVVLGPNWFLAPQGFSLRALDRVEVTGSRLQLEGKPVLVAREINWDNKSLKLRDDKGNPLWGGPRKGPP